MAKSKLKSADSYLDRGRFYARKGDMDKAIADFTGAIGFDPNRLEAYLERAHLYNITGNLDGAVADYTEALRIDPANVNVYFFRSFVYARKDDLDSAIADYTAILRIDPTNTNAYFFRSIAYRDKGDSDNADSDYAETIRLNPNHSNSCFGKYFLAADSLKATALAAYSRIKIKSQVLESIHEMEEHIQFLENCLSEENGRTEKDKETLKLCLTNTKNTMDEVKQDYFNDYGER